MLIVPALLFAVFIRAARFAPTAVQPKFGFVLFILCGASQIIALSRLRPSKGWSFGWAKFSSYILKVVAVLLLVQFGGMALFQGYYFLFPDAPMLFGGC